MLVSCVTIIKTIQIVNTLQKVIFFIKNQYLKKGLV